MKEPELRDKIESEIARTEQTVEAYHGMTKPVSPDAAILLSACCTLCEGTGNLFYKDHKRLFYQCAICKAVFSDRKYLPGREEEKLRYLKHDNDVHDAGYQAFVAPVVAAVTNDFTPQHRGLDFGAGTGPVVSKLLNDLNFQIEQYDPFFSNIPELLEKKYDYIICCEVIEHFHNPRKEFALLRKLLHPGGRLYCMTGIYSEEINFEKWYYKNDPTHAFIYHEKTFRWIKEAFGFSYVSVQGRLITFFNL